MFALRACLEMAAIIDAAEEGIGCFLRQFSFPNAKKNLAGTVSGKVLAEKPGFEPGRHLRTLLP